MQIEKYYEDTTAQLKNSLNIKNIFVAPFLSVIGLISAYVTIYSYYKDKDKTIYIYYAIIVVIVILCNIIYILFKTYKNQTAVMDNFVKDFKNVEINRNALIEELNDKNSKLKKYKRLYWATKTFFLNAVKTSNDEERNKLLAMYTELKERDDDDE
ncbi:hypothetical protein [Clostridium sp. JN-9]|uniref:hypothetical protein n=1 Tax=Clostridium sp. JN-9 TaxID=2507159 RepID=UPI000FFE1BBB|nr:hypothetical protein [Clostridium sp. JN-9]QAT40875.1 hypothetical protein EQM05_11705 [Clostridium sp. JN-9]